MADFREMTSQEAENQKHKRQERRAADCFECPHCGASSGVTYMDSLPRVERCHKCGCEYFAWTVPATVYVSSKM